METDNAEENKDEAMVRIPDHLLLSSSQTSNKIMKETDLLKLLGVIQAGNRNNLRAYPLNQRHGGIDLIGPALLMVLLLEAPNDLLKLWLKRLWGFSKEGGVASSLLNKLRLYPWGELG